MTRKIFPARLRPAAGVLALLAVSTAGPAAAAIQLQTVLPPMPVSEANASVFATPLAYRNGAVYTVNVEPGTNKIPTYGLGLNTVVRRGQRDADGRWRWTSHLIDPQTPNDPYHTQASIGLDKRGYVHVVYAMHYLPWRYSVSARPDSIDKFIFRGQRSSVTARYKAQHRDVEFPGPGTAAIPGIQVTYPAFFTDRNGELYVTYRYAVRPKRTWAERVFAGSIARYDVNTRRWIQIGGDVSLGAADVDLPPGKRSLTTRPFAMEPGWWTYQIRLAFDRNNGMHASWLWRIGNSGPDNRHPSYAYAPAGSDIFYRSDGSAYTLPIRLHSADWIAPKTLPPLGPKGFYNPARMAVTDGGNSVVSVQAVDGRRYAVRLNDKGVWQQPEPIPYDAWQIRYDDQGREWAFATGLIVFQRDVDADGEPRSDWRTVFEGTKANGGNLCSPRIVAGDSDATFFIHGNVIDQGQCRDDRIAIVRLSETG
ncbi:BNR-4 repeat-containing protein [Salinisphaera aquimarina]|uniref:BNR-4 repeat-containing protein n=1 Tax=Salinisphaera aquimarina TaxID=2094031 RepID=A0ABV7EUG8_9GAMM